MSMHNQEIPNPRWIMPSIQIEEKQSNLRRARAPLHILVIEDEPVTQNLLRKLFESDYPVTLCADPYHAVNEYMRVMPDLVFLDINLGNSIFNGLDILYTLRMIDQEANVVMLTSHDTPQNIAAAAKMGAFGFAPKPFKRSRLMHYVQECEELKARR